MSDETLTLIAIVTGTAMAFVYPIFVLIHEVYKAIKRNIKTMISQHEQRKQEDCFHIWRRLDATYNKEHTMYRDRCDKCKLDKLIDDKNKERFERDFLVDHYGDV